MQDPKLLAALVESRKRQAPYAGAFLLKDAPGTDATVDTEKSVHDLKGKELLDRLHEVGTLVQVTANSFLFLLCSSSALISVEESSFPYKKPSKYDPHLQSLLTVFRNS